MEDDERVRRALYGMLRDCKLAQRAGIEGGALGSQQVIHIGDAPVTININGDMHFHSQECPKPQ